MYKLNSLHRFINILRSLLMGELDYKRHMAEVGIHRFGFVGADGLDIAVDRIFSCRIIPPAVIGRYNNGGWFISTGGLHMPENLGQHAVQAGEIAFVALEVCECPLSLGRPAVLTVWI